RRSTPLRIPNDACVPDLLATYVPLEHRTKDGEAKSNPPTMHRCRCIALHFQFVGLSCSPSLLCSILSSYLDLAYVKLAYLDPWYGLC
ncbi:hypothetical protein S245_058284, partial [Arachis hypogaea]